MITFDPANKLFRLSNEKLTCVLMLRENENGRDELLMPYIGAALPEGTVPPASLHAHVPSSFDPLRQVLPYCCPTEGRGDYRPTMIAARDAAGNDCTELYWTGAYTIADGKPALPGLPATYAGDPAEAQTLTLTLADPVTGLTALLSYTIFTHLPVIAASVSLTNAGDGVLTLEAAGSLTLALQGEYELLHLHGAWARERAVERVPAGHLTRQIESVRGASGHEHNPFAALLRPGTDEFTGECIGVNLIYSGDFRIAVDQNAYGSTRLVAGLNPRSLRWRLAPGESFQTPEAVCVYSGEGLNAMSQAFHTLFRRHLCRGEWRDRERPILINNWEGTYFHFDHERIMSIARPAADLGVELFVLDDGWFGRRDNDDCSLGDWVCDRRKLPRGLKGLGEEINALGLRFGLWFEPEMISPDSDLYRAHPDWCLHVPGRPRTECRRQLVLDMSRTDVQDYVIEAVSAVLRSAPIDYVKWDSNRNFTETGSALLRDGRGGELHHRFMLGLYRVLEAITSAFPQVLFESCSGGGGRFDAGMLYYMPQTWTSDDTDAVERLRIQWGTSLCYPACAMGAHVSAIPNHQVGRMASVQMRGDVALGGNFGYELDLSAQTPEDLAVMRQQIARVKRVRATTQQGVFTRLLSPFEGNLTAWQFADEGRIVLCVYRTLAMPNPAPVRVRLRGIPAGSRWQDDAGRIYTAAELMQLGIEPAFPHRTYGDFAGFVLILEKVR